MGKRRASKQIAAAKLSYRIALRENLNPEYLFEDILTEKEKTEIRKEEASVEAYG
jgi:hypothetical protein